MSLKSEDLKKQEYKDSVTVDFTNDAFKKTLDAYDGDIDSLAKDLAPVILYKDNGINNPAKLNRSEYSAVAEIVVHYEFSSLGWFPDHTNICDLVLDNDGDAWISEFIYGCGNYSQPYLLY